MKRDAIHDDHERLAGRVVEGVLSPYLCFNEAIRLVPAVIFKSAADRGVYFDVAFGTTPSSDRDASHVHYVDDARVPRRSWQSLSGELRELIVGQSVMTQPRCGVFALDARTIESLAHVIMEYPPERATREGIPFDTLRPLYNYLNEMFGATESSIVHGATWDIPGLDTVTVDHKVGKYIGLHLDSWDAISFDDRDRSRTRLCVNLGPDVRSFLYVPIRLREAAKRVSSARGSQQEAHIGDVVPGFLWTFPDFPVIRINIPPSVGYFADTDNLVHDGSSLLAEQPTLHFTMRGRYEALDIATLSENE